MNNSSETSLQLKTVFTGLLKKFKAADHLIAAHWRELEQNYSDKKRHYHTLDHLRDLLSELDQIKHLLADYDVLLFSLFYHDAVYNAKRTDNEERSAELAVARMKEVGVSEIFISRCAGQILATKSHTVSSDADTNYFTDADLSILGRSWEEYESYYKKIRREYSIYPDFMYNPGRKKVLAHFLAMKSIFKTDAFIVKYEQQARTNLLRESSLL